MRKGGGGGRKRKHKVIAVPRENGLIKSDLHFEKQETSEMCDF